MMRLDIGDLSREIAAYVPVALVKQFGTRRLQCAVCFDAGVLATTATHELPVSNAVDLYFYRFRLLTRRKARLVIVCTNPSTTRQAAHNGATAGALNHCRT